MRSSIHSLNNWNGNTHFAFQHNVGSITVLNCNHSSFTWLEIIVECGLTHQSKCCSPICTGTMCAVYSSTARLANWCRSSDWSIEVPSPALDDARQGWECRQCQGDRLYGYKSNVVLVRERICSSVHIGRGADNLNCVDILKDSIICICAALSRLFWHMFDMGYAFDSCTMYVLPSVRKSSTRIFNIASMQMQYMQNELILFEAKIFGEYIMSSHVMSLHLDWTHIRYYSFTIS